MTQLFVKQRVVVINDVDDVTPPIDVQGVPFMTHELIVYTMESTASPSVVAIMQTSNDLITWTIVSGASATLTRTAAGSTGAQAVLAETNVYGKYIRYSVATVTSPGKAEYSLILNTYPDS